MNAETFLSLSFYLASLFLICGLAKQSDTFSAYAHTHTMRAFVPVGNECRVRDYNSII